MFKKIKIDKIWFQFFAHWIYILMSLKLYQSSFPFLNFLSTYAMAAAFIILGKKFIDQKYFNHTILSVCTVCNSIYLNMGYDYHYFYFLHLIVLFALNSKLFLRNDVTGRGMFNPSITGIFLGSMLFPSYVTYGPILWSSEYWQILIIFGIGSIVTLYAKTILISYSYFLSYVLLTLVSYIVFKEFAPSSMLANSHPMFWILGLFSFNKLIHIFHVISDPQTGPQSTLGKIIYGASIASVELTMKYLNLLNSVLIAYVLVASIYQLLSTSEWGHRVIKPAT